MCVRRRQLPHCRALPPQLLKRKLLTKHVPHSCDGISHETDPRAACRSRPLSIVAVVTAAAAAGAASRRAVPSTPPRFWPPSNAAWPTSSASNCRAAAGTKWRGYEGGVTALCTLALLNSGVGPDDPVVRQGAHVPPRPASSRKPTPSRCKRWCWPRPSRRRTWF